jgi:hypothetical protein
MYIYLSIMIYIIIKSEQEDQEEKWGWPSFILTFLRRSIARYRCRSSAFKQVWVVVFVHTSSCSSQLIGRDYSTIYLI